MKPTLVSALGLFRRALPVELTTALALAALALPTSLSAALIGYENFNHYTPVNSGLSGKNGGRGWSGAWTAMPSGATISSEGITYTLDGRSLGGGQSLKLTAASDDAFIRGIDDVDAGTDIFVSFLVQIKGGTAGTPVSGTYFTGWQAGDTTPSISNDSIGYVGASGKAGARVKNTSTPFAQSLNYGQTYLFVIKYTNWSGAAYQTTKVWLNPSAADEATANTAITQSQFVSGGGSGAFTGLRVRSFGLSSSNYQLVDEIRVGTSWDDVVSPPIAAPTSFAHPGITVSLADLAQIKARVNAGQEPQTSAYNAMIASSHAQLTYQHGATANVVCSSGTGAPFHQDARAVFALALRYYVSGNSAYADHAISIMDAWSGVLNSITTDPNASEPSTHLLHTAWVAPHYAEAAEIIRHTYKSGGVSVWPDAKITQYKNMLRNKMYPLFPDGFTYNGNWETSFIRSIMAIGIFCDDKAIYERGTAMLRGPGKGGIGVYIYTNGQCQETLRISDGEQDKLHLQMGMSDLLNCAEMVWKQGSDIYSAYPDAGTGLPRLAKGWEYAMALLAGETRPLQGGGTFVYNPAATVADVHERVEYAENHFSHRLGIAMPWTTDRLTARRATGSFGHSRATLTHGNLAMITQQPFATTSRKALSDFSYSGWGALDTNNAINYSTTPLPSSGDNAPRLGVHNVNGMHAQPGVLFAHSGGTNTTSLTRHNRFVVTTTFPTLSLTTDHLNTIGWDQASNNAGTLVVRALVKVGTQWYASTTTHTVSQNSSAASMTNAETKFQDLMGPDGLGSNKWTTISFGAGSPINRSTTPVTVGTTLSGLGLLLETDNAMNRAIFVDNIRLTSFP